MSYAVENHATSGSHIRLAPGTMIANTYEVIGEAGSGNFARVFECRDVRSGQKCAVKLMKPGYERDADFEQEVLNAVNKNDPSDNCGIVRMIEKLRWNNYTGLAFTLKGKPLRNSRFPMSRAEMVQVGKDLANSLHFLHFKCRAVHTDLKPENILAEIDPSKPQKWVLCDFGSASFYSAVMDNDLITTRPYRAPEVVLKRGWNYNADTWSFGCILFEVATGRKLFDAQSDAEHLEVMQARLGPIPASLFPPRTLSSGRRGIRTLKEELAHEPELLAVIEKLLTFDPAGRPKCADVLSMPFFSGSSATSSRSASATTSGGAAYPTAASFKPTVHSANPTGIENTRPIYATQTAVMRTSGSAGLSARAPTLQAMSSASTNVPAPVSKASFGTSSAAASNFRVQHSNYAAAGASSRATALPHPSQLPRPGESYGYASAVPSAAPTSGRGIMSPAMPNYVR